MKKITVDEVKSSNEKKILLKDVKGTPFDDTFRTLLERCRKLIIPVINEVFGTDYSVNDEVEVDLGGDKVIFKILTIEKQ